MDRIESIRQAEKKYHEHCYDQNKIFEEGSWLHKPVKTVFEVMNHIKDRQDVRILDLGCGVGRNSIPMAELMKESVNGEIICVDLLESALVKLMENSKAFGVEKWIIPVCSDIGDFQMTPAYYDVIVAVSSIEHVKTKDILLKVLENMAIGTKIDGYVCIILNTNIQETDIETNQSLEPLIEVNLATDEAWILLNRVYSDWEVNCSLVKSLSFEIDRDGKTIVLTSDCITYVVKKVAIKTE